MKSSEVVIVDNNVIVLNAPEPYTLKMAKIVNFYVLHVLPQ